MKAVVYREYGSPDVLHYEDIEKPVPGDGEVVLKVHSASVNPLDWHLMRGEPFLVRMMSGLRKPKLTIIGVDVAGRVEAVGPNVTTLKPGDEVFGVCDGSFAEYGRGTEARLVPKPANVSFEQAAAVPVAAITALQALRDRARVQPGQNVLVIGASGGVGLFAVQIAKTFGARVTGVCSTRNVEMVRSLGADRVIDYTQKDFTQSGERYDVVFDAIGNRSLSACISAMAPKGIYLLIGAPSGRWIHPFPRFFHALLLSRFVSQTVAPYLAKQKKEDLLVLRDLLESGKIRPVIDRHYSLRDAREAVAYVEEGHARGKVVITIA